jgi:hypothetical protein
MLNYDMTLPLQQGNVKVAIFMDWDQPREQSGINLHNTDEL